MHHHAKRYALVAGFGAIATLGALGIGHSGGSAPAATTLAGSGDAPTGTVYVQPTAKAMILGSTSVVETITPAPAQPATKP
jgi:hypothetical protein